MTKTNSQNHDDPTYVEWGSVEWAALQPLRHQLNPCDIARKPWLAPLGDAVAHLAVECPCCNGIRILTALAVGIVVGALVF